MSMQEHDGGADERFAREAGRRLRESADELDATTLARLKRARHDALAELDRGSGRRLPRAGWQPALGAAAVCATAVVALALWFGRVPAPPAPGPATGPVAGAVEPVEDLEAVLDDDNLEMIENLEFYDWLDSEPVAAEPPPTELTG